MIYIKKQPEPASLRKHRSTPGADFDSFDKTELRQSLLEEQGFLCAYCMRRIRDGKDIKIEHFEKRNKENQLIYSNLLAVCTGNETLKSESGKVDKERFTCDTRKGDLKLHINPQSMADMATIYYDNQGTIYSKNTEYNKELNDILNLNDEFGTLKNNRKAVVNAIINRLRRLKSGQSAEMLLKKFKVYCEQKNDNGEYPEYVGIMRWYVDKHLKKY